MHFNPVKVSLNDIVISFKIPWTHFDAILFLNILCPKEVCRYDQLLTIRDKKISAKLFLYFEHRQTSNVFYRQNTFRALYSKNTLFV